MSLPPYSAVPPRPRSHSHPSSRRRPVRRQSRLLRSPSRRLLYLLFGLIAFALIFKRRIYVTSVLLHAYTYPLYSTNQVPYSVMNGTSLPPSTSYGGAGEQEYKVPNIFHSLFLQGGTGNSSIEMKPEWVEADQECRRLHPDAQFMRWTDANASSFVNEFYPEVYDAFVGYKQNIQRSNILRYLLLHHFGGIYLDLDLKCRINLDHFRRSYEFVTPPAAPSGVNNAFIASAKGHLFWRFMIDHINYFNLPYPLPYVENMASTGCLFFTSLHLIAPTWIRNSMFVLPGKENRLRGRITTPLFEHFGASSWHKGDARMILALGQTIERFSKSGLMTPLLLLLSAISAYVTFRLWRRQRNVKLEEGEREELSREERDIMMEDYSHDEAGSYGGSASGSGSGSVSAEEDEDDYGKKEGRWIGVWGAEKQKEKGGLV